GEECRHLGRTWCGGSRGEGRACVFQTIAGKAFEPEDLTLLHGVVTHAVATLDAAGDAPVPGEHRQLAQRRLAAIVLQLFENGERDGQSLARSALLRFADGSAA